MVKPDASKDYYAILDLKSDASTEDIKKAYHKLALKWHPDRNHGSESEASTKFQDISAAYDILIDPTVRAKYDADRLRLHGRYAAFTSPTSNAPNPYTNWPRPAQPPRPQPAQSGQPNNMKSPTSGGAQRYAGWTPNKGPWPEANAGGPQSGTDAAHAFRAWGNMNKATAPGRGATRPDRGGPAPSRGAPSHPPNVAPRARPPRPNTFANVSGNAGPQPTPKARAGWDDFDLNAPPPGMTRSKTMRTPKKGGFDPGMHDGDEPPARNTSAYSHMHRGSVPHATRPQPFQPRPAPQPGSQRPETHRPDPFKGFRSPRSEENFNDRLSTPYATSGGEKTYFSSEGLSRDPSSGSASNLQSGWEGFESTRTNPRSSSRGRHRSASPRMRSPNPQPSSSSDESSIGDSNERPKLRPKGVAERTAAAANGSPQKKRMPPPPKPSVTVENPNGETFEPGKPIKRSTWSAENVNGGQTQPEKLSPSDAAFRRTSLGDLPESVRQQHARRSSKGPRPPSPLQTATPLTNDNDDGFEPLEKTPSWQETFGYKKGAPNHRHFDPPNGSEPQPNYFPGNGSPGSTSPTKDTPDRSASQFSQHVWQQKFSSESANPFHPPPTLGAETRGRASPMKPRPNTATKTPRKMSTASKRPVFPQPASVSAASSNSDEEVARASSTQKTNSAEHSSSSSAMDIDSSTPPVVSEMRSTRDPLGQAIRAQAPNKTPTGSAAPSPALKPNQDAANLNMKDFTKAAPFAASNSNGLGDLGDLNSNLPFPSTSASTLPTVDIHPHKLELPRPPDPPKPPNLSAMKKSDLEYYMVFVCAYMASWNMFNHKMLGHFQARQVMVETGLPKNWLDGVGLDGCSRYLAWMQEDTRVRSHWDASYAKHIEVMSTLEQVKKAAAAKKFIG